MCLSGTTFYPSLLFVHRLICLFFSLRPVLIRKLIGDGQKVVMTENGDGQKVVMDKYKHLSRMPQGNNVADIL
jgi:hypothetical protein